MAPPGSDGRALVLLLITCQFPGKTVSAGGVSARVRSKQAAGEAMGAPLARPRHTWGTGRGEGREQQCLARAEREGQVASRRGHRGGDV